MNLIPTIFLRIYRKFSLLNYCVVIIRNLILHIELLSAREEIYEV